MAKTVASADITRLDFSVLLDMSTAIPTAKVTNLSTVINPLELQWAFEFLSPSGTPIHKGNFTTPDINKVAFTTYNFTEQIPQIFRQLEFNSSSQYTVKVDVKDAAGVVHTLTKGGELCVPNGNKGNNNFGAADIDVEVKCNRGQLFITDKTNLVYKNINGNKISTSVEVTYPKDRDNNVLAPVLVNSLPALLPIKYEGAGYEVYVFHVYNYDLGDNFNVRVRYSYTNVFAVWCNVTLYPLFCEIDKISNIISKNCNDNAESRQQQKKLIVINSKMLKAHTGIVQPLSGIDVPEIVNEIKDLLGVDCDCCSPAGISDTSNIMVSDANFLVNKVGGDMLLSWSIDTMGNITLNYEDTSYVFIISADSKSSAFSYQAPIVNGKNKTIPLKVDISVLATEILTEINNNSTLLNILNSLTQKAQVSCTGLNGGAAFDFTTCDYSVELSAGVAGARVARVVINGVIYEAPQGLILTGSAAIALWLNSLSKGVFTVNYSAATAKTTISTTANPNAISTIATANGIESAVILFNNNCGLICNILQKIITYLNDINLLQIKAGAGFDICSFSKDGSVLSKSFTATDTAGSVVKYMADSFCNIVEYTKDKLVTCDSVKGLFAAHTSAIGNPSATDVVFMSVKGKCQQIPIKNLGASIISLILRDSDIKDLFCQITPCAMVSNCSPVEITATTPYATSVYMLWDGVVGAVGYKWSLDGITWNTVAGKSVIVENLTPGTPYIFRVYPVYTTGDGTNCIVAKSFITLTTTACVAPANLVFSNITSEAFFVSWNAVTAATAYEYRINGGGWISAGLDTYVSVAGLTADTVYNFEVAAVISNVRCVASATGTTTTMVAVVCAAPTNLIFNTVKNNYFRPSWDAVAGATAYEYRVNGGAWINNGTALTVVLTGLTPATLYTFEVAAVMNNVRCTESLTGSTTTTNSPECALVTNLVFDMQTSTSFRASWDAVAGVGYAYRIGGGAFIDNGTANSVIITGMSPDTYYNISVAMVINGVRCTSSKTDTAKTLVATPVCAAPTNLILNTVTNDSFTASWNAVAGATAYEYRINGGGAWINNGTALTVTLTGLTPGTLYGIEVSAVVNGVRCAEFVIGSTTTTNTNTPACAAPTNLVISNTTTTSLQASWDAVIGATAYEYRIGGGAWVRNTGQLTTTFTGLTPGTLYMVEVAAVMNNVRCAESASYGTGTATVSPTNNFHIGNDAAGSTITGVVLATDNSVFYTSNNAMPLVAPATLDGGHNDFNGVIRVSITGSFAASCLTLFVNNVVVLVINVTAAGSFDFPTRGYVTAEDVSITFGVCS